jgi:hypothetical protein
MTMSKHSNFESYFHKNSVSSLMIKYGTNLQLRKYFVETLSDDYFGTHHRRACCIAMSQCSHVRIETYSVNENLPPNAEILTMISDRLYPRAITLTPSRV